MSEENALSNENTIRPLAALPSLEYLLTCSMQSLQDLELAALGRVANHLKAAKLEWELAASQKELAGVARWLIECRDQLLEQSARTLELHTTPQFPEVLQVTGPKKGLDTLLGRRAR